MSLATDLQGIADALRSTAQWTVDGFASQLSRLDVSGRKALADLDAQKLDLQHRYTAARNAANQSVMDFLTPLIHKNSELRMKAADFKQKYNWVLGQVSNLLRAAGLRVPATLSGLGIAPALVIIPATVVVVAIAAVVVVHDLTKGTAEIDAMLKTDGARLLAIANDPTKTPGERQAATKAYDDLLAKHNVPKPSPTDWGGLIIPGLALVAFIVAWPSIARVLPQRKAAA